MKKLFTTFILFAFATSVSAQNYNFYDFSAVCESGQTLYYSFVSDSEVELSEPSSNWNGYTRPTGHLIIPETVEHEGIVYTVVSIGQSAFYQCSDLTSVDIPSTIVSIQEDAFYKTGLTSLEIPNSIIIIKAWAFSHCTNLLSLTIGTSVTTIETGAFHYCTNLQIIHCNTPTPPAYAHAYNNTYYDGEIFANVPTDIPVYVSCLAYEHFQMDVQWDQFTNMQGVFVGTPELNVSVNSPGLGTAEIVSIPENCDHRTATVRATPNPGHEFSYWRKGIEMVSFSPEYTFVLDQNTSLIACFDRTPIAYDSVAYPDHVIGRVIDASGQVTVEYPSDFNYNQNGTLTRFDFPSLLSTTYSFINYPTMPSRIFTVHGEHPVYTEEYLFSYQNNKIQHLVASSGMEEEKAYVDFFYDDNGHLIKRENSTDSGCWGYYLYDYEDNYRTQIESYFYDYPNLPLRTRTTNHYNERLQLLTSQIDTYNSAGDTTSRKLKTYTYTIDNKPNNIVTQTLNEGVWMNSNIAQYVYDDMDRVVEYQTGNWLTEDEYWDITRKILYEFDDDENKLTVSFRKKISDEWTWDVYSGQTLFYESELNNWNSIIENYNNLYINQFEMDFHYVTREKIFPWRSEWYYEIEWENGDITYQHLDYVADTTIGTQRPKVIVRSNTQYDRDTITEVTHEYIYEEGNMVYWWNKDLEEFTLLYDYNAETGDEWEIKVGTESITVHVDGVDIFEYDGDTFKRLYISDVGNIFNGEIVVGFGHMTSFFPEKLMNQGKGFRVNGLRCYWVEDALLYHNGEEDCDAIHSELQEIVEPTGDATFAVYPNPTNNVLYVETRLIASLPGTIKYRIINLTGQTVLSGNIIAENQQIDIEHLPAGMYFITVGGQTVKFVVK